MSYIGLSWAVNPGIPNPGQGHREFPFGNSRESRILKLRARFFEMSILQLHLLIARVIAKTIRISLLIIYKEICIL